MKRAPTKLNGSLLVHTESMFHMTERRVWLGVPSTARPDAPSSTDRVMEQAAERVGHAGRAIMASATAGSRRDNRRLRCGSHRAFGEKGARPKATIRDLLAEYCPGRTPLPRHNPSRHVSPRNWRV